MATSLTYSDVMGLCRLAYKTRSKHSTNYLISGKKWYVSQIFNSKGYRAITAHGKSLDGRQIKVLAFSGTDELRDWGASGNIGAFLKSPYYTQQYQVALSEARRLKPDFIVGHSLGGGLSLHCSVTLAINTATINPAPLFDPTLLFAGSNSNYSWIVNYCVDGEMLAAGRLGGVTPGKRISVPSIGVDSYHCHLLGYLSGFTEPVQTK